MINKKRQIEIFEYLLTSTILLTVSFSYQNFNLTSLASPKKEIFGSKAEDYFARGMRISIHKISALELERIPSISANIALEIINKKDSLFLFEKSELDLEKIKGIGKIKTSIIRSYLKP